MKRIALCVFAIFFAAQAATADDGFGDIFAEDEPGDADEAALSTGIDVTGEIGLGLRYFLDDGWDSAVAVSPEALLALDVVSDELAGTILFDLEVEDKPVVPADVIDELYLRAFFDFGYLTAGLLKVEWGKGDGTHVVDPLNPLVQEDGIDTDLYRMKRAEAMIMASIYIGENGLLETVYKPHFHPQQSATSGRWATGAPYAPAPDTCTLKYSQGAARLTGTIGPVDLGALYYYGFMQEPGYDIETVFTGTNPLDPTQYETVITMVLTRAHLAGIEAAAAAGPFTFRGESGFWITEDTAGEEPELYNHRLVYLGGFDVTVPGTSVFLSVQMTGAYVFDFPDGSDTDVDRMISETSHRNTIVGAVEIPFALKTMKIRLSGIYAVEEEGYMIIPEYRWNILDDLELSISGQVFGGSSSKASLFEVWDDNDNIEMSLTYTF